MPESQGFIRFFVDRDAVAAGDDLEPHAMRLVAQADRSIESVILGLVTSGFLPAVEGGGTWSVTSGRPLAVVSAAGVQWVGWPPIVTFDLPSREGEIGLYFNYHGQVDAEVTLRILRRLRLDPFPSVNASPPPSAP